MHQHAMGERYARELKLDVARFEKDLAHLENKKRIDADKAEPFEGFATVINSELSRLELPVPAGAPAG